MPIDHQQLQRFGRLELLAKQAVEGFITGLHKSPYHGFSVEFAEHRAYNSGESTRHIDWKLYGRTDKMFVKRFEEETNLRCQIVIDRSGSMFYPKDGSKSKVQFACESAAALTYLLRNQRDAVGLTLFGEGIEARTPAKSSSVHYNHLFNQLEGLYDQEEGSDQSNISDSIHLLAEQVHKRSLVIIFSDFMDSVLKGEAEQAPLFQALQHLRYNKHEVILFHLFDKKTEVDFDLENRPYELIDLESGDKIKLMPNEIRGYYTEQRDRKIKEVKLRCRQYRIDWNETDTAEGVSKVLDRFIAKRMRMR
ncbi:MAG: DUF58 domain-containing protein [Flavobacteriales bacterium]|jgi:uncharacterized protein (DUF58 family)|nr:DUF58 domain-containing protein [Flavobacteriales bacterium]NCG30512.1 DUF58 domain-containing protein [Bacteroidota bacterium]MBT3962708.1 DUF58 domain-containing protein [Flavobacteriales bacterium]MBT4704169.1 DUF58 domain-containing protein [Flavobacteriales bacterium]MBT4930011.1 DUF58 domain-containing protein [Flavobacteriales bacterium]